jgi:hypothetical protein
MSAADEFDRTAAQVDLTLWEAELYFGERDPLEVLREFIKRVKEWPD